MPEKKTTKVDFDFEAKLDSAKNILQTLMDPEITLQNSIDSYEKGIEELNQAQKILESAQLKINEIKNNE